jgi:hypothetical protein
VPGPLPWPALRLLLLAFSALLSCFEMGIVQENSVIRIESAAGLAQYRICFCKHSIMGD